MHVCIDEVFILDSRLAIFVGEESVLFCFLLVNLFYCGAVTLSTSFFSFDVLERKVLGNCIDS